MIISARLPVRLLLALPPAETQLRRLKKKSGAASNVSISGK